MVSDTLTLTKRNILNHIRIPESFFFATVQPIMFVLLFRYVFGGAIKTPEADYVNYLMPGIFVQTVAFGSVSTGIGLAEDLQKGLIERFRALPMSRSAVLAGRTTADLCRNVFVVIVMTAVGFLVGFRPTTGVLLYVAGCLLILAFAYSISWGMAVIGLSAPNSETAQVMSFPLLFPLTFASSAFVPVSSMPSWLQGFATYQPVSVTVTACRALMIGGPTATLGRPVGAVGDRDHRGHGAARHPALPHQGLILRSVRPLGTNGQNGDMADTPHDDAVQDTFGARSRLKVGDATYQIHRIHALADRHDVARLPYSIKVILENLLRHEDGLAVKAADVEATAGWGERPDRHGFGEEAAEIAFTPERVLMQDFTGVPGVVDIAAMRDALVALGGDPSRVNPLVPVELVIDHSVIAEESGTPTAFDTNVDIEYQRNIERYQLLGWAQQAFDSLPGRASGNGYLPPGQPRVPLAGRLRDR